MAERFYFGSDGTTTQVFGLNEAIAALVGNEGDNQSAITGIIVSRINPVSPQSLVGNHTILAGPAVNIAAGAGLVFGTAVLELDYDWGAGLPLVDDLVASRGVSSVPARLDHVHPLPTEAFEGLFRLVSPIVDADGVYNGAWVVTTLKPCTTILPDGNTGTFDLDVPVGGEVYEVQVTTRVTNYDSLSALANWDVTGPTVMGTRIIGAPPVGPSHHVRNAAVDSAVALATDTHTFVDTYYMLTSDILGFTIETYANGAVGTKAQFDVWVSVRKMN